MPFLSAEILSATGAGCATTIVGHPLDVVKVHLQTNPSFRSTRSAASYLLGQNALFRGIGAPLFNAVLMNTVMFSVFSGVKKSMGGEDDKTLSSALLAGCISGFATACISTPTDYVKIQAQLYGTKSIHILQQTGMSLPILFRGHVANLCREGTFTMAYLGLYDYHQGDDKSGGIWQVALTSSITGGLAWVISYPFDTVKSLIQKEPPGFHGHNSLHSVARRLWERGGISAFYKGCGASTGRAMMVTSLRMIVYEFCMKAFQDEP